MWFRVHRLTIPPSTMSWSSTSTRTMLLGLTPSAHLTQQVSNAVSSVRAAAAARPPLRRRGAAAPPPLPPLMPAGGNLEPLREPPRCCSGPCCARTLSPRRCRSDEGPVQVRAPGRERERERERAARGAWNPGVGL